MLFRTHIVFSLLIYFLLGFVLEMPFWVLGFILLSTAFVDVDARHSKFGKKWYFRPLQWLTRHRGVIHSLLAAILLSLVIGGFNLWAGFGFFVGYISHLFIDCFTVSGVALFWPFKFKIKGFVKSGSWVEDVIFVLLLFVNVFIIGKIIFVNFI
jgi:inner membrane protein